MTSALTIMRLMTFFLTSKIYSRKSIFMKNTLAVLAAFSVALVSAQSKQDVLDEAKRRNITSQSEAIAELNKNGISLSQAEEMARMRGMNLQSILNENFSSGSAVQPASVVETTPEAVVVAVDDNVVIPIEATPSITPKEDIGDTTRYFGYEIFENNPFGEKDYLVGNIDEGYILAPGDEIKITVYGNNALDLIAKIDLNGNIVVPGLGVFQAAGNSFKTFRERLTLFLGKFYSGLVSTPPQAFMDVSLTQIRPVKVTLLGEVVTPGPHLVNGLATVLNALYASGGIKTSGTLREIKVYRNGRLFKTLDLYDFIRAGRLDQDIRLTSNDIIFVAPRTNSISLDGAVKDAGVFELKSDETLEDLIRYSGGLPANASLKDVNISRTVPAEERSENQIYNRYLKTISLDKEGTLPAEVKLLDGDQVFVRPILEKKQKTVSLQGSVKIPGEFSVDTYADLKSLIEIAGGSISENTYLEKVDISRKDSAGNLYFKTYSLRSVLTGEVQVQLNEEDVVRVYSEAEVQGDKEISINGFVSSPKTVTWREGITLFDLIFQATSYEELVFQSRLLRSRIDLRRFNSSTGLFEVLTYNFDDISVLQQTTLRPKDGITLYTRQLTEILDQEIEVLGAVRNPGSYSLDQDMLVEDALIRAGGFIEFANQQRVLVSRKDRDLDQGVYSNTVYYDIDMEYLLGRKEAPENPFVLQHNDIISVLKPIRAEAIPRVTISGEVIYPGPVTIDSDQVDLNEVVKKAGGFTNQANLDASYVIRGDQVLFFDIQKALRGKELLLNPGDQIIIGSKLASVLTLGGVVNPSVFSWDASKRAKYYLRKSGGLEENFGKRSVVHSNGTTDNVGFLKNPKVYPGDRIVVAIKPEKERRVKEPGKAMEDLTRIIGIVTGSLTSILLASRL